MKILVFGAGGIIGQHMLLCKPKTVEAKFYRRQAAPFLFEGIDLTDREQVRQCLETERPQAIVNLAGESSPDLVEREAWAYQTINQDIPAYLACRCDELGIHYVHVSSQIVLDPVNAYGRQKLEADHAVSHCRNWTIVRPTFVLGIRPLVHSGRSNPAEQMLEGQQRQVTDRYFSPSFAWDVAAQLWQFAQGDPLLKTAYLGVPVRTNRHDIALRLGVDAIGVPHASFRDIAQRPLDTTYLENTFYKDHYVEGLARCVADYRSREAVDERFRAREIALFLGIPEQEAFERLHKGFWEAHAQVKEDFNRAKPKDDEALLEWYRTTESYIWELSAYHANRDLAYDKLCEGLIGALRAKGAQRVLCLGDGIGTLTLKLHQAGLEPGYHDLAGSRTAHFAEFRFWMHTGDHMKVHLSGDWNPPQRDSWYDAVVSLDFLEHVTEVPAWAKAVHNLLRPGGLFMCQNAFACGSGESGSIPCHLERNDRFVKDWDPLLASLGFIQESANWYRRPETAASKPAA